jgi:hypothetical protein
VPLDLSDDRRGGVRGELHPALGLEAVDGLDQADRADLDQVVQWFASVAIAPGQVVHERQMQLDELVAQV